MWIQPYPIILASKSPRRRELLGNIGLEFKVMVPETEEPKAGNMPPAEYAALTSRLKCEAVSALKEAENHLIIAADTVVVLGNEILGKPKDERDARRMLAALSGREHKVCTGVTVMLGGRTHSFTETTAVRFRNMTEDEITAYIATGEPMDKAGAYGIQKRGAVFVQSVCGDYFNVVGLPLCSLTKTLAEFGVYIKA